MAPASSLVKNHLKGYIQIPGGSISGFYGHSSDAKAAGRRLGFVKEAGQLRKVSLLHQNLYRHSFRGGPCGRRRFDGPGILAEAASLDQSIKLGERCEGPFARGDLLD
jgi:hypothetical protein